MPNIHQTRRCILANPPRSAAPFVGPLDALIAQGAVLRHASSVRRLLSSYSGAACKLRGNGAGALEDISFLTDGSLDLAAAAALAAASGGTQALWHTAYDQSGIVNATQTTDANQMEFSVATEAKGAMGGAAAANKWFNLNLGTITQPSFFLFVVNIGTINGNRVLFGTSASATTRFARISTAALQQNWGVTLAGSNVATGKHTLGFLSNDTSSKIYVDGALDVTGDADNTLLDLSGGRIGALSVTTTNWTANAGNTLSEVIIFDGDPTGLAGWSDFITAQKAYFSIS